MGYMKELDIRIRNGGDDAVAAAIELMPRWIPVEEQLPERRWDGFSHIVVVAAGNSYFLGRYYKCEPGDECHECDADLGERWYIDTTAPPTHWMPLPEPPATRFS
jgi:hypothetical protein